MGITAYEDTFKSKNTYKNIFTGINKEEGWALNIAGRNTFPAGPNSRMNRKKTGNGYPN